MTVPDTAGPAREALEAGLFAVSRGVAVELLLVLRVKTADDPHDKVRDIAKILVDICQEAGTE